MSDDYTAEELAKLPQSEKVFDAPAINLDDHKLVQEGYTVKDICDSHPTTSFAIPSGKLLIKEGGKYKLVNEQRN